jgi:peptide/nickel transport system substrate-binding protein
MHESEETDRRTFLKYAGVAATGATLGTAGCVGGDDDSDNESENGNQNDSSNGGENGMDNGGENGMDNGGESGSDGGQTLESVTVTQGAFPDNLDPVKDNSTPTYNVIDQAYEPFLYRDKESGEPVARVVDEFERIDENTVELQVRDGVTFHNGDDCTAEDVAFSINRAADSEISEVAAVIGDIDEAVAVDDSTVEVSLNSVVPVIFRNLGAFGRVTEKSWIEDDSIDATTEMNGTGPYQLVNNEEGTFVEYEIYEDYWGEQPNVQSARFNGRSEDGARVEALEAGESDVISAVPPDQMSSIRNASGLTASSVPSIRSIFLVMNDILEPFTSVDFRRAMNYAVDVGAIIDTALEGFGAETAQPTLEGQNGHNPDIDPYPYDPEQAETLVEESGFAGESITLDVPVGRYVGGVDVAETAAGQIDELPNVSCEASNRDFGTLVGEIFAPEQDAAPPFYLIGWGVPTLDADYAMRDWFGPEANSKMANDEEIENLLEQAENTADPEERVDILQQANARAHEQAYRVFLHQQFSLYGYSDDIAWEPRSDEDILVEEMSGAQ